MTACGATLADPTMPVVADFSEPGAEARVVWYIIGFPVLVLPQHDFGECALRSGPHRCGTQLDWSGLISAPVQVCAAFAGAVNVTGTLP